MSDEHPLPWKYERSCDTYIYGIWDANGHLVASVQDASDEHGHLMAAAPELLFACKAMSYRVISEMNAMTDKWDPDWDRLKRCLDMLGAALAAAESENSE